MQEVGGAEELASRGRRLETVQLDWRDTVGLDAALQGVDALLHTAGPYLGEQPDLLQVCTGDS